MCVYGGICTNWLLNLRLFDFRPICKYIIVKMFQTLFVHKGEHVENLEPL